MKAFLRSIVFTYIAFLATQYVLNCFIFGGNSARTFLLVILAFTLLNLFLKPLLGIISLPTKGYGYLFLCFVLTFVVLQVLTVFVPSFRIVPTTLSGLIIFGFVLPSKSLTALLSGVFSALLISAVFSFLSWLSSKK